jgi:membrane protease subunit HflC
VIVADANQQSEQVRGQGDAERNRIFAEAFGQDPDFFAFYRSMQAYERSMPQSNTRLVLRPDTDFFRYFADPSGKMPAGGAAVSTAPAAPAASATPNPAHASSATK